MYCRGLKAKCMVFKLSQTKVQVVPSLSDPDHPSLLDLNMNGLLPRHIKQKQYKRREGTWSWKIFIYKQDCMCSPSSMGLTFLSWHPLWYSSHPMNWHQVQFYNDFSIDPTKRLRLVLIRCSESTWLHKPTVSTHLVLARVTIPCPIY